MARSYWIISSIYILFSCTPSSLNKATIPQNGRSQAEIGSIITEETQKLKNVYEEALKRHPGLSGKLNVRFVIQPNGKVKNVSSTLCSVPDTVFVNELLRYISLWQFPNIQDTANIEVVYPFVFEGEKK
jgi:TonB family protein